MVWNGLGRRYAGIGRTRTFVPSNVYNGRYQDSIALSIAFENKGQKDIAGVKRAVQFIDVRNGHQVRRRLLGVRYYKFRPFQTREIPRATPVFHGVR